MNGDSAMEFQLTQARYRAIAGTLAIVCSVAIPFFGWLGTRYVANVDEASNAVGRLTTELAVLNTQVSQLRDDLKELRGIVRDTKQVSLSGFDYHPESDSDSIPLVMVRDF